MPIEMKTSKEYNYSNGYVNDYYKSFLTINQLEQAVLEGSVAASKVLTLISPGSVVQEKSVQESSNGDVMRGNRDDVQTVNFANGLDPSKTVFQIQRAMQSISNGFLMSSKNVRDAERVTTAEIRMIQDEMQKLLAGMYASIGISFQIPYINRKYYKFLKENPNRALDKNLELTVITGLELITRNAELEKLRSFVSDGIATLGENFFSIINPKVYIQKLANANNYDISELLIKEQPQQAQPSPQEQLEFQSPEVVSQIANSAELVQGE